MKIKTTVNDSIKHALVNEIEELTLTKKKKVSDNPILEYIARCGKQFCNNS